MRDPTVSATAAAEATRVRDAIDYARYRLLTMFSWLHHAEKNLAAARYKYAINLAIRVLNDTDDDKIRKADERRLYYRYRRNNAAPDNPAELKDMFHPIPSPDARNEFISDLQQGRPPKLPKPGRRANTGRDESVAEIIDSVRRSGFDPTRSDATKDDPRKPSTQQSACSIVAAAWRELAAGKMQTNPTRLERGRAPLKSCPKPLSERSLERIWDESEWASLHRLMKASGIRDVD
jgi:hypothetical protein